MESKYWVRKVEEHTDILVYTENLNVLKEKSVKKEPDGMYFHPKNKMKLTGVHYICEPNDATHKALVKFLGLTETHEVKEKRKRRTKEEMRLAREGR